MHIIEVQIRITKYDYCDLLFKLTFEHKRSSHLYRKPLIVFTHLFYIFYEGLTKKITKQFVFLVFYHLAVITA